MKKSDISNSTYTSREDSELLRKSIQGYSGHECLEVGIGYGSNLLELHRSFELVVGTDISLTEAFSRIEKSAFLLILTDGAAPFREDVFDLVICNPPYLPSENIEDSTIDGGRGGFEVTERILKDALRVIKPTGTILLVQSSETSRNLLVTFCERNGLSLSEVLRQRLFFEQILVYEIKSL